MGLDPAPASCRARHAPHHFGADRARIACRLVTAKASNEPAPAPLLLSQRIAQICLFLCAIALFGGTLQMWLGQPDTTARLDNVHRFLAGIYFGCGLIALWAGFTIRDQDTLVYLIAPAVLLGGIGRRVSMGQVGLPEPRALWLTYVGSELILPCIIVAAQFAARTGAPA